MYASADELIKFLSKLDPRTVVLLSSDPEGNKLSEWSGDWTKGVYIPEGQTNEIMFKSEEDLSAIEEYLEFGPDDDVPMSHDIESETNYGFWADNGVNAVILWPDN